MKCDIRITTQYRENYGTPTHPHWKPKGSVEFIIRGVDDNDVIYHSRSMMDEIIGGMLSERSNVMCSYELLHWESIFAEPVELSTDEFNGRVKGIYDRDFGI
jgi:hypothetical protein